VQRTPLSSSSAPSRAVPRPPSCSPPPQRGPGLYSSRRVVRARGAYLHVARLAHRPLPVIASSGRAGPPPRPPARAAAATDTSSPCPARKRTLGQQLKQTNAARARGHNAPSRWPPPPARLRPPARGLLGRVVSAPHSPHAETTPAREGRAAVGLSAASPGDVGALGD
jgi:hypothetical protein